MNNRLRVQLLLALDLAADFAGDSKLLGLGPALRNRSTRPTALRRSRQYKSKSGRVLSAQVDRQAATGGAIVYKRGVDAVRAQTFADMMEQVFEGRPFERVVGEFLSNGDKSLVRRYEFELGWTLYCSPTTRAIGAAVLGKNAHLKGTPEAAASYFGETTPDVAVAICPVQYVEAILGPNPPENADAAATLEALLTYDDVDADADGWMAIMGTFATAQDFDAVERLITHVTETVLDTVDEEARQKLEFTFAWMRKVEQPDPVPSVRKDAVSIAVIDYGNPRWEKCSSNIGDFTQTVAAMGHLVRIPGIDFGGDEHAVEIAEMLRDRVRPEFVQEPLTSAVDLVRIDRDASSTNGIPDGTWLLAFGWHMLPQYGNKLDFPYTAAIKPLFISFHCNNRGMMTPETVAYLKANGPIGCRDWYTYDLLTQLDVPAFFSGCLTTTLDTYWNPKELPAGDKDVLFVDATPDEGAREVPQADPQVRFDDFATNMKRSVEMLDMYRATAHTIVTSRLHSYLPARTLGLEADFRPKNPADLRYEGLITADADGLQDIRDGIREVVAPVMRAIVSGADEAAVRALWAEHTKPFVERSRAIRSLPAELDAPNVDIPQIVATVSANRSENAAREPRAGERVELCFGFDKGYRKQFHTVMNTILERTDRAIRVWALCRDLDLEMRNEIAEAFPEIDIVWLPFDGVDYGAVTRMIPHISMVTMDRLMLPEVVDVPRIVYLDLDLLPQADVAELFDLDLDGHPIAARSSIISNIRSGFHVIDGIARATREPRRASVLRKLMLDRHDGDFTAFNAGVLVMDLENLRGQGFSKEFVPYVGFFGAHDQDVLNCFAGADRLHLEARWNSVPTQEVLPDPSIIHWAGAVKPWAGRPLPFRERWVAAEQSAAERCARYGTSAFAEV